MHLDDEGEAFNHRVSRHLAALELDGLAALEPGLQGMPLRQDQLQYKAGAPLRYPYYPHDTVVSLVAVLKDSRLAEIAVYGQERPSAFLVP